VADIVNLAAITAVFADAACSPERKISAPEVLTV
jgi:hypothetical protein